MSNHKYTHAIGVSIEGEQIRAAKVIRKQNNCEIAWVKSFSLATVEASHYGTNQVENIELSDTNLDFDMLSEVSHETKETVSGELDAFSELATLAASDKSPIGLAVSEPQIYYNIFDKTWGLTGRRLIKKLISESGITKSVANPTPETIKLIEMDEGRVLAISHERSLPFYHRLEAASKRQGVRAPKIELVDGVELSLVNLIHEYQCPLDGSLTIIVHITEQTSRFIFLQGTEILHFSHLISEGSRSPDLAVKLYNRLQFELDNGNIKKIDSIILSGLVAETTVREMFEKYFGSRLVKTLKLHSINTLDLAYADRENIAPYAPAIGVACRMVDERMKCLYQIDVTPANIHDSQNRLSLSPVGWTLLVFLPILIVGILFQMRSLDWKLRQYQATLIPKIAQKNSGNEIEKDIVTATEKLSAFEKVMVLLDSLQAGNESYGGYLAHVMEVSAAQRGTWFTEVSTAGGDKVELTGFSIDRNRIPEFANQIGAEINSVEAQEIREHPVYRFELTANPKIQ